MSDRRTAEVHIYKGEDLERLAQLRQAAELAERRYKAAKEAGTLRKGDEGPGAAKDAYDEAVADAATRATTVRLMALGRRQWRALLDDNEPRRVLRTVDGAKQEIVHEDDEDYNVDITTFGEKLLNYVDLAKGMRTIVEPEFSTDDARAEWLDDLSGGDFDRLWVTAYYLNGEPVSDPKGSVYSTASQSSSTTSA